jgi:putative transposase
MVYVSAFVIDAYSRRILGWRAARSMKTALVLDALEQALWTRQRNSAASLDGLVHHTDANSSNIHRSRFTDRLAAAGVSGSVGTAGDAYDNAVAESVIGLFKDRADQAPRPWRTAAPSPERRPLTRSSTHRPNIRLALSVHSCRVMRVWRDVAT